MVEVRKDYGPEQALKRLAARGKTADLGQKWVTKQPFDLPRPDYSATGVYNNKA